MVQVPKLSKRKLYSSHADKKEQIGLYWPLPGFDTENTLQPLLGPKSGSGTPRKQQLPPRSGGYEIVGVLCYNQAVSQWVELLEG